MERTQLYLPRTYKEALRKEALKRSATVSEVVRLFLRDKMGESASGLLPRAREPLIAAAKRINALGRRGPRDLASRLDAYLYGTK